MGFFLSGMQSLTVRFRLRRGQNGIGPHFPVASRDCCGLRWREVECASVVLSAKCMCSIRKFLVWCPSRSFPKRWIQSSGKPDGRFCITGCHQAIDLLPVVLGTGSPSLGRCFSNAQGSPAMCLMSCGWHAQGHTPS